MFSFRTTRLEDQLDKALMDGKVGCFCTQNCWDTSSDRYMYLHEGCDASDDDFVGYG